MRDSMHMFGLISKATKDGTANFGRGPRHPASPHMEFQDRIDSFLSQHSFLNDHPDYADFLLAFAGGGNEDMGVLDEQFVFISIYGFSPENYAFQESEYKSVNSNGFFPFCDIQYRYRPCHDASVFDGVLSSQFMFDSTGTRKHGVYVDCKLDKNGKSGSFHGLWFCNSFTEWLESLVSELGRIPTVAWIESLKAERGLS